MLESVYDDSRDVTMERLTRLIEEELAAMQGLLSEAQERQWLASPAPRPAHDGSSSSERPPDPTADAALDPRRLAVRETVLDAKEVLYLTLYKVRGVRRGIRRALDYYDGDSQG